MKNLLFLWFKGVLPLDIISSGPGPGGRHPRGDWRWHSDNSYLSV